MVKQEKELRAMLSAEGMQIVLFDKPPGHYRLLLKDPVSGKEFKFHAPLTPGDRRSMQNTKRNLRALLKGLRE